MLEGVIQYRFPLVPVSHNTDGDMLPFNKTLARSTDLETLALAAFFQNIAKCHIRQESLIQYCYVSMSRNQIMQEQINNGNSSATGDNMAIWCPLRLLVTN